MSEIKGFPICWPFRRQRTPSQKRRHARFNTKFGRARDNLLLEIRRLGGTDSIISSNIPYRNDGLPRANAFSSADLKNDPGIAVYFKRNGKQLCFACDCYLTVDDNMHAIAKTVEALRGIARWGTGDMMEAAFTGFMALPEISHDDVWQTLGIDGDSATEQIVMNAWREKAKACHPDVAPGREAEWHNLDKCKNIALATVKEHRK